VGGAWIVLTLVVMNIVPASLVVSLGAYGCSVAGICMGAVGAVTRHESNKRKKRFTNESAADTLLRSYEDGPAGTPAEAPGVSTAPEAAYSSLPRETETAAAEPEAVVWDFNGTILDDVELVVWSVNEVLRARGLPAVDVAFHREHFSFPLEGYYLRLGIDIDSEGIAAVSAEYHRHYMEHVSACGIHAGAHNALELVREAGVRQYVLSAMHEPKLWACLAALKLVDYFNGVYGLPDIEAAGKEQRAHDLIREKQLIPERTLYIGDTSHDLDVAVAAGFESISVAIGHESVRRLSEYGQPVLADSQELTRYMQLRLSGRQG